MVTQAPVAQRKPKIDRELEEFRGLMEVPSTFEEGFNWKSLAGALFIALIMVPGAIFMDLLAGQQGIGDAARWVTVILFVEVARRAQNQLKRSEIFVLYYMASAAMGMPFFGLLWNQFFARSQAAQATGIAEQLPHWFAPALSSASYATRSFISLDWLPVIGMIAFTAIFSNLSNMVLGYGLFRLTSDVERLPFPMAPVGAQGVLALAEDTTDKEAVAREDNWRWRVFSIGGAIGLLFGAVYLLLPTVTGAMTGGKPVYLFTIPFVDLTARTQDFLPAVATGMTWNMGSLMLGMVFPFFAMLGSFTSVVIMAIANPLLYKYHILQQWKPGDDTIVTTFKNNIDFYFSFVIGLALAVAAVGIYQMIKGLNERRRAQMTGLVVDRPAGAIPIGRGDIRVPYIIACYFLVTISYILVSGYLIHWHHGVMLVLIFFGFLYTPLISYVTARLEGMAGQMVEIPFIKEAGFILSGYQGVAVWFLPIPLANYGGLTTLYRQSELTGTRFTSIWKAQLIIFPIILISSFVFMNFIWGMGEVPSALYPFANKMWDLNAANQSVIFSSTMGEYSQFNDAFKAVFIACGAGFGLVLFSLAGLFGAPVLFAYGVIGGFSQMMHFIIPQMFGALLGKFVFQRKWGLVWRQYVPVVAAGFFCGAGLITVLGFGIMLVTKAVIQPPF